MGFILDGNVTAVPQPSTWAMTIVWASAASAGPPIAAAATISGPAQHETRFCARNRSRVRATFSFDSSGRKPSYSKSCDVSLGPAADLPARPLCTDIRG